MYENLGDCLKESVTQSLFYFLPAIVILALWYLLGSSASYLHERAVLIVLVNGVLANSILSLMLCNMCGRPFRQLRSEYLLLVVPLVASYLQLPQELYITRVCCFLAYLSFYAQIAIIAK